MSGKLLPNPTPETRIYWEKTALNELWMPYCQTDGWVFPPRFHCPTCASTEFEWRQLSGRGTIASFIITHRGGAGYQDEVPYFIILVDLEEGPRLVGNLYGVPVEPTAVEVGMPVEVFFELRDGIHLPQWRPVGSKVTI